MPNHTYNRTKKLLGGSLQGKTILILGISYRQDVGDTRFSPVELLVENFKQDGVILKLHDPHVDFWEEQHVFLEGQFPNPKELDAVILCVAHKEYVNFDYIKWLNNSVLVIVDANNVLSESIRNKMRAKGTVVESIGRGSGL